MAKAETKKMKTSFVSAPFFYDGFLYGFSDVGVFSKVNLSGVSEWTIDDGVIIEHPFSIHFNLIFFIDSEDFLVAYDVDHGQQVWRYDGQKVRSFYARHPHLLLETIGGKLVSLDLFSGREEKVSATKKRDAYRLVGRSGVVAEKTGKSLVFLDLLTFDSLFNLSLPHSRVIVESSWNRGVILGDANTFYIADLYDESLRESEIVPTANGVFVQSHYYAQFSPLYRHYALVDLESDQKVFDVDFGETFEQMFVFGWYALLINQDKGVAIVDLRSGDVVHREVSVSLPETEPLTSFYVHDGVYYLLFEKSVLQLEAEKDKDD